MRADPGDMEHVRAYRVCAAKTRVGNPCEAMTNYVCRRCNQALCGRHSPSHWCVLAVSYQ